MIVVAGAGPAGLAAAWRAARAGHEVTVVERADHVGGMAASFEVAGLRVDHGSHRLHPATSAPILGALRHLLGDDLQERPRNGRIRLLDRWVAFPLQPGDLLRHAPRRFALAAARDAALGPFRRPRADTFAEVIRAGLGPAVLDAFYGPYATKLWGTDASQLDGELARRRVSAGSAGAITRRLLGKQRGRTFLYPRRGFGAIVDALADAAVSAGATIRLGTAVDDPKVGDGELRVELSDGTSLDTPQLWSTLPLTALAPDPPSKPLQHRAMVLLYMVLDQPRWTTFDAHYFPGPEVSASRLSEPRNYRDSADDPADVTVLCAEIPCWPGDDAWQADDAVLAERLVEELAAAGLPPVRPTAVESRRLAHVYPVYRPGFRADLAALEAWAGSVPGLITFGRQGLFTPDNTHHALAMGWAAAAALGDDGTFDASAWVAARDGFRDFVVED